MPISRYIFLSGHRKSGTSVFHRLFDGHPGIFLYPVDISVLYAYFPKFTAELQNNPDKLRERLRIVLNKSLGNSRDKLSEAGLDTGSFAEAVIDSLQDDALTNRSKVITAIAEKWVEMYYQSDETRPFVFKETSQSIYFAEFSDHLPDCRMISLIRDPRDNYAAIKSGVKGYYSKMGESELESLASVINRARMDLISASLNESKTPKSFKAIRFEDLTTDTEKIMRQVAEFSGIEYRDSLCFPTQFGEGYKGNSHEGVQFKGIEDRNVGRWKERISDQEAMIIEYWLGDVMSRWNYQPEFDPLKAQEVFADFYDWYNARYFFHDSFKPRD